MGQTQQFSLGIFIAHMGVSVEGNADIRMAHDVLQGLGVHAGFCHVGTEGMPAHMGRHLGHGDAVDPVVLLHNMLQILLPVECHHGHVVLVQEQKTRIAVYHRLPFRLTPVGNDPPETGRHILRHGNITDAAFRLGPLDHILHLGRPL